MPSPSGDVFDDGYIRWILDERDLAGARFFKEIPKENKAYVTCLVGWLAIVIRWLVKRHFWKSDLSISSVMTTSAFLVSTTKPSFAILCILAEKPPPSYIEQKWLWGGYS